MAGTHQAGIQPPHQLARVAASSPKGLGMVILSAAKNLVLNLFLSVIRICFGFRYSYFELLRATEYPASRIEYQASRIESFVGSGSV